MSPLSTRIATLALSTFTTLPPKSRPRAHEWTPLSAIILSSSPNSPSDPDLLTLVSLATGTKCLPAPSLPRCNGAVLHDCHAEVLALRGWNRWLLAEIERLSKGGYVSRWVEYRPHAHAQDGGSVAEPPVKPFILRPDVRIYLFSTEAPCGDASMGLLIESTVQTHGDATAWPEPEPRSISTSDPPPEPQLDTSTYPPTAPPLHGRAYFSLLGLVRRKPSRADAEPTLSKSCTDKLTLKQLTSVLAWPVSLFVQRTENVYLKSLVLPVEKYDEGSFDRAFGRLGGGEGDEMEGMGGLAVKRFGVLTFPTESNGASLVFPFSKPSSTCTPTASPPSKASNVSALWVADPNHGNSLLNETLVNGVKQGAKQWGVQEFKMSGVCRRRMWEVGRRVEDLLRQRDGLGEDGAYLALLGRETYDEAKQGILDADRRSAKEDAVRILGGWVRNEGDGAWGLS